MDLGLEGKVALVAGGTSGLGLAVARALAAEGASVAVAGRDPERLDSALAALAGVGPGETLGAALDVRDEAAVRLWVDGVADTMGALHIVVANAGGPQPGAASALDPQAYREAIELSLLSSINVVHHSLGHLRAAGWGRILFVTSQSVRQPIPGLALSNVARPGVVGYAKSLVADLGDAGITVNVLAPGSHRTARLESLAGDDVEAGLAAMASAIPLGRIGDPAEFGAVAAFLASEQAGFVTGAVVPVDGGSSRGLL